MDNINTITAYGCHNRQLKESYQTLVRAKDSAGNLIGYKMITIDRKSTRLNSSHLKLSRMPSSA